MKKRNILSRNPMLACLLFVCIVAITACEKFVDVPPPVTSTNAENVYVSDGTAIAVLTSIYSLMSADNSAIGSTTGSGLSGMTLYPGLSGDEFTLSEGAVTNTHNAYLYYKNKLASDLTGTKDFWVNAYAIIYYTNAAIEGLTDATKLTPAVRRQLLGEAHFLRAFSYFYLVNLYGDVPKVLSTNYSTSFNLPKSPKEEIYQLIIEDAKEAQTLLADNYLDATLLKTTIERVRPNKFAASALLARVYLYHNEWKNAEDQATMVIQNSAVYDTVGINNVFLKNSKETIWSLQPVTAGTLANTGDGRLFIPTSTVFPTSTNFVSLSPSLLAAFDLTDSRYKNWVKSITSAGITYYYPFKYKIGSVNVTAPSEYLMVLRLAEQYLIRAEARAKQSNFNGALTDLNVIRKRASLAESTATGEPAILTAIYQERQIEFFAEWGHRWLDLKRIGLIDMVMPSVALQKGTTWDPRWALYPIPSTDVLRDPNLIQNPGY
ncbi:RagB/SusD family nutrient uptake outer membrane protein [Pedobacter chinensis]|uniref:RagB/SusD family nutrient uptake outer membrane protein n=1 Tax=Pedobacter chinensis TaxID=2282421 RepID=A0A369PRV3_9SPHI|nr:RagB/SusD family nutrient uptake outer membrane protein [Pedobacter chinensis]RDC55263.1 RagB/SusD family nutrient uptake outer membrane protein [Pedobacter chinensis]